MNDPEWARKQEGSGATWGRHAAPNRVDLPRGGGSRGWIVVTLPCLYEYYGDTGFSVRTYR